MVPGNVHFSLTVATETDAFCWKWCGGVRPSVYAAADSTGVGATGHLLHASSAPESSEIDVRESTERHCFDHY